MYRRVLASLAVILLLIAGGGVLVLQLDSDDDGLTDVAELSGWSTADGTTHVTSPRLADTDGDGLSDLEEAGQIVTRSGSSPVYSGASDPTEPDSDHDGLDDLAEVRGWASVAGALYRTEPMSADTDQDGLTDGMEAGKAHASSDGTSRFNLFSDPRVADIDGDGLSDAAEADYSIDAFAEDSDGDGLSDFQEVDVLGTAPDVADTDGDGFDDAYEIANQESQGLDPLWPDTKVDTATYALEFAQGAVLGELLPGDSLAWLAGDLASGGASFIPGIGWVIGGVSDLRDAVASVIHSDWVGAGFSLTGLLPGVGDAAAVPAKAARFIARHPELGVAVVAMIAKLDWLDDAAKLDALTRISPDVRYLKKAGSSEEALVQLQTGRGSLGDIAQAMKRDGHVRATDRKSGFFESGSDGEKYLASLHPPKDKGVKHEQVSWPTADCEEVCNAVARRFDVFVDGIAYESKVGRVDMSPSIRRQIESDAYFVRTKQIEGAHWEFFASSGSNSLGPSPSVLDLLDKSGITYTIHLP